MPNWCEGSVRIRGMDKDITRFLKREIKCLINPAKCKQQAFLVVPPLFNEDHEDEDLGITLTHPQGTEPDIFYFEGSQRNFIQAKKIVADYYLADGEDEVVVLELLHAAWAPDYVWFSAKAKDYNIDFRIFGFECGAMYTTDTIIERGTGQITENTKSYEDYAEYRWDVVCPNLGG